MSAARVQPASMDSSKNPPTSFDVTGEKTLEKEAYEVYSLPVKDGDEDEIKETDYTSDDYQTLLKKIDRYLLPLMWVCYGIQQTDKTSLGTQALFGLREDTHLKGQEYQWLTTIFYISYLCGEFPSNFLLQRWALGRTLSIYMLCWGICVTCIAAAQNWGQLMALRALQGLFECTISPGFILIVSTWYRTEEHSARALFWQSANAGFAIVATLIEYGIGSHAQKHGGIEPWRAISLFLGCSTIVCALVCFAILGSPKEVRWLNKEEKRMAAARIVKNKSGRDVTGTKWNWAQVYEAFLDPQFYFCVINAFLSSVPNGALTTFGSLMYASFGFTELQVLLVDIPRNVVSLIIFLAVGIYTRRVKNRRLWIMTAATLPPFAGLMGLAFLPNTAEFRWTKWGMYMMTVPFVLALFLAWTLISSNVAGRTKKTIISSGTFLGYCIGNMCGSQIFKTKDAPRYIPGTIGCAICLGAEFLLLLAWRIYYTWQNRRRDRRALQSGLSREEQEALGRQMGEKDITDINNPHFSDWLWYTDGTSACLRMAWDPVYRLTEEEREKADAASSSSAILLGT
ncbi:MFS general substrate transporter [Punctularia strigosozonata HHB-11173 SS5]|uniref:MFS general substrate transporter n=1 Tax=Punctularia strigosozonata (strain HHB-11173) TaxID=741275 RepID=UPI000441866B|nr:MFS general substrate transporter [Punctularia strigosozonata HHB-11173 SS5]EIN14733.1 MFS general substrate transporter [Punctularia strigosozonata HHB-11173 SS5]